MAIWGCWVYWFPFTRATPAKGTPIVPSIDPGHLNCASIDRCLRWCSHAGGTGLGSPLNVYLYIS